MGKAARPGLADRAEAVPTGVAASERRAGRPYDRATARIRRGRGRSRMNIPDRPSARGAGIAGDDYQHLFTWLQALKLLITDEGVIGIGLEVGGGHNVDD